VLAFGMAESGRDYSPQDVDLTEELARRAAVAVDNALLYTAEQHARRAAERAVERTARLQEITAALAESYTEEQVAGVIVEQGRLALGATGCAIFRTDPLRGLLHLTAAAGLSEEALTQWETIHWSTPTPAGEAAATGQLVLAGSPDVLEERFPGMFLEPGWQALAAIPLVGNGETRSPICSRSPASARRRSSGRAPSPPSSRRARSPRRRASRCATSSTSRWRSPAAWVRASAPWTHRGASPS
jgi:GAF domain-containing protein